MNLYDESIKWCRLMRCETVAELNELTDSGKLRELVRINEALHERKFSYIADMIYERGAHAVMLAGPSSSGKTTSANRLATQLGVLGKNVVIVSLDDYYFDRDKLVPDKDGKIDFEHINTIDTGLFRNQISKLLRGEEVEIPNFNFKIGVREWSGNRVQIDKNSVIIVEGIHALNPVLLPAELDRAAVFKIFISPLLPMRLDERNRIPTSYLRLLRRIVRDYNTRGSSVKNTLSMWDSVRRGEKRWIQPFRDEADVIFNSATLYELPVLKKHIYPLLCDVGLEDECCEQVLAMVKILNHIHVADVDDEIPPTSLVREFIGGNAFYR